MKVIIIGNGIAGPVTALELAKLGIHSTIYEVRETPATIGGAINLTPNALRVLDHVGILEQCLAVGCATEAIEIFTTLSAASLGDLPFGDKRLYGYTSLRIERKLLQSIMLEAIEKAGIKIEYSKKLVQIREEKDEITAIFEDESSATGDLIAGCDGIHSAVRIAYVDPERIPTYTGISGAYGYIYGDKIQNPLHFKTAGMTSTSRGSVLTVYTDPAKTKVYVAGVMEVKEEQGRDGWKARASDVQAIRAECIRRFATEKIPCVEEMISKLDEIFFYPVYTLDDKFKFFKGRAILLGDALHAMPPGGESTGVALEDCAMLARILKLYSSSIQASPNLALQAYEAMRAPHVLNAYKKAVARWQGTREIGWLQYRLQFVGFKIFLQWFAGKPNESFAYNVYQAEIPEAKGQET